MGRYTSIIEIEAKLRASVPYAEWVKRNKGHVCFQCESNKNLQLHHIVTLYHIILGLWRLYGDWETTYEHCIVLHQNDRCETVTLCKDCHENIHPGRTALRKGATVQTATWAAIPRNLPIRLTHGTKGRVEGTLGLIAFQSLFGIGWMILSGYLESRMIILHHRKFARLLGKAPGTSFNQSLLGAFDSLEQAGVIIGHISNKKTTELHFSTEYLDLLANNPWFFPIEETRADRIGIVAIKWFMSLQGKRSRYKISLKKLVRHVGLENARPHRASKIILDSCDDISWANASIEDGMFTFHIKRNGSVPIHSLRQTLSDSIELGR